MLLGTLILIRKRIHFHVARALFLCGFEPMRVNIFSVKIINQNSKATKRNNGYNRKTCDKRSGAKENKNVAVENAATVHK